LMLYFFFFFQAEDGIRDKLVTGVQTCALPISGVRQGALRPVPTIGRRLHRLFDFFRPEDGMPPKTLIEDLAIRYGFQVLGALVRSEERRVGKECRSRWEEDH